MACGRIRPPGRADNLGRFRTVSNKRTSHAIELDWLDVADAARKKRRATPPGAWESDTPFLSSPGDAEPVGEARLNSTSEAGPLVGVSGQMPAEERSERLDSLLAVAATLIVKDRIGRVDYSAGCRWACYLAKQIWRQKRTAGLMNWRTEGQNVQIYGILRQI